MRSLSRLGLLVLTTASLTAAVLAPVDEVAFVPKAGMVLRKTFERTSQSTGESLSEHGDSEQSGSSSKTLVVLDTTVAVEDGRVTKLQREFVTIGAESASEFTHEGGGDSHEAEADSDLEGETVTFEWDDDEQAYDVSSEDADDDLLEHLTYDLDLGLFLPDGTVEEEDEWEIDLDLFKTAVAPWKHLKLEWERDGEIVHLEASEDEADTQNERSEEGELTATYKGTREVDGVTLAMIALEGELEILTSMHSTHDLQHGGSSELDMESTTIQTIEGEVLWNLAGGHLHSLELRIEEEVSGTFHQIFTFGDQEFESESETNSEGTDTLSISFEAVE
jgi:hypothetical protein